MVTPEELESLLSDIEADRVEFTSSLSNTDKFSQAVCAFSNDLPDHRKPGYLIIGAKDDGMPAGMTIDDQLLQNLGGLRSDGNIQPIPDISVAKMTVRGGEIAVVEVRPSDLPPVRYKGQVWIRVGPRRGIASETEERRLSEKRQMYARTFDARPCAGSTLKDLALSLFEAYRQEAVARDIIENNHRTMEEQLASLRFYEIGSARPTFAGILLFAKNPRYFLPGAYVQFLRFSGTEMTDVPVDQAEVDGDLLTILRELDTRLRAGVQNRLQAETALKENLVPDYPERAVRELLLNAILHRDYESTTPVRFYWFADRIEIQNPGGLYGEVTPENFMRTNSYRNPILAEAMKNLGYVNRFGYGIQRAQALLKQNGNPEASFRFEQNIVAVSISGRAA